MSTTLHEIAVQFDEQLSVMANVNHCGAGLVTAKAHGLAFRARIQSVERLACEVESVHVAIDPEKQLPAEKLQAVTHQIAGQLSYLEEELRCIEHGPSQCQLRSRSPEVTETGQRCYFEMLVGIDEISLHRFEKSPGQRRQPIPMVMTKKHLSRLGHDLLTVLTK